MLWFPIIEDGIFRFDASEKARKQASPSLSFVDGKLREVPVEPASQAQPTFIPQCTIEGDVQTVTLQLPAGTSLYGTGEVSGSFERSGKRVFGWNTDAYGYGRSTTSLYQTHPWVLAVLVEGTSFGFLADTTRRSEIDLRKESTICFRAIGAYPVITFGPYQSPEAVLRALSKAIGTISMPAKWTLGYQQCRWSYDTAEKVKEVVSLFREKKLPCDVIWMDIDYMDGFRCFTFHPENFSDPTDLSKFIHDRGFKGVWMLDPGIKYEKGYSAYESGSALGVWVLQSSGEPYVGEVWPGEVVFPDYTLACAREWWGELVKDFSSIGLDGIWNDMNEPAVFKTMSKTMPDNNRHAGDEELGGHQSHLHYHNVYGLLMARSTFEGMLRFDPNRRPFVLTRAGFMGSQRYAATWTGDNVSNWEHLQMSIPMALNLGLSGQPFSGPDIGGFAGNCTPELFARWIGIGALMPFSRGHSEKGTADHEPWSFGKECEKVVQLALFRRYRFLPHLYTLFHQAHKTGVPVMTPLFFADPKDPKLRNVEDSYLLGDVLVSASIHPQKSADPRTAVLPKGVWQLFDFGDSHQDLPLLYLKGGGIVPTGPVVQHTGELNRSHCLTLLVALDETGSASGTLYEDDGDGFGFQSGQYLLTTYVAKLFPVSSDSDAGAKVILASHKAEGLWTRAERAITVRVLLGDGVEVTGQGVDGDDIAVDLPPASKIMTMRAAKQQEAMSTEGRGKNTSEKAAENCRKVVELNSDYWSLKIVPWIGGRIISMIHNPTGVEWLEGRLEMGAYEEYAGVEYRSPGCTEEYNVIKKDFAETGGSSGIILEADLGGGLVMLRQIDIPKASPKVLRISSSIEARSVGAGSGGFSRLVCLRVHPSLKVSNSEMVSVKYIAVDGTDREILCTGPGEIFLHGSERPNGEWTFHDKESETALVNRFKIEEVATCLIHWAPGMCNMELWSVERAVSKDSPVQISHEYQVKDFTKV